MVEAEAEAEALRWFEIFSEHDSDSADPNHGERNPSARIDKGNVIGGPTFAHRLLPEIEATSPLADVVGRLLRNHQLHRPTDSGSIAGPSIRSPLAWASVLSPDSPKRTFRESGSKGRRSISAPLSAA